MLNHNLQRFVPGIRNEPRILPINGDTNQKLIEEIIARDDIDVIDIAKINNVHQEEEQLPPAAKGILAQNHSS